MNQRSCFWNSAYERKKLLKCKQLLLLHAYKCVTLFTCVSSLNNLPCMVEVRISLCLHCVPGKSSYITLNAAQHCNVFVQHCRPVILYKTVCSVLCTTLYMHIAQCLFHCAYYNIYVQYVALYNTYNVQMCEACHFRHNLLYILCLIKLCTIYSYAFYWTLP